jgi:cytochrome d ubiquinol oxidase subunit II
LLRPYPLLIGLLGFATILLQGSTYTAMKMKGTIRTQARSIAKIMFFVTAILFAITTAAHVGAFSIQNTNVLFWIFVALFFAAIASGIYAHSKEKDGSIFVASSLSFALMWACAGFLHFPRLVSATGGNPITAANAASGDATLSAMLIIALIFMPMVIAYKIFVYRIFKGRIEE